MTEKDMQRTAGEAASTRKRRTGREQADIAQDVAKQTAKTRADLETEAVKQSDNNQAQLARVHDAAERRIQQFGQGLSQRADTLAQAQETAMERARAEVAPVEAERLLRACWGGPRTRPDRIYLTRTFIDAATIREIDAAGMTVISFGNPLALAEAMRAKYPAAEIVFCGDCRNDLSDAAKAVNGRVAALPSGQNWADALYQFGPDALLRGLNGHA